MNVTVTIGFLTLTEFSAVVEKISTFCADTTARLQRIEDELLQQEKEIGAILMEEKIVSDLLTKIDQATDASAVVVGACVTGLGAMQTTANQIDVEVKALIAAQQAAGVSQALVDQATALQAKVGSLSTTAAPIATTLTSVQAFLNGIAAEGQPIVPPPPPPPPPVA